MVKTLKDWAIRSQALNSRFFLLIVGNMSAVHRLKGDGLLSLII